MNKYVNRYKLRNTNNYITELPGVNFLFKMSIVIMYSPLLPFSLDVFISDIYTHVMNNKLIKINSKLIPKAFKRETNFHDAPFFNTRSHPTITSPCPNRPMLWGQKLHKILGQDSFVELLYWC